MYKARILVVDDHPILRHGIAELINREADLSVAAEADSAEAALEVLARQTMALAIVDISLPGVSGLELIKTLKVRYPQLRVLVMSMHDEMVYAERALRAGARGYIMKQEATKKIVSALRQIRDGAIWVSDRQRSQLLERFSAVPPHVQAPALPETLLSDREFEVFRLIGQGLKTGEIARTLKRSVNTVEAHRANIKKKLNVSNAAELARVAFTTFDAGRVSSSRP